MASHVPPSAPAPSSEQHLEERARGPGKPEEEPYTRDDAALLQSMEARLHGGTVPRMSQGGIAAVAQVLELLMKTRRQQ